MSISEKNEDDLKAEIRKLSEAVSALTASLRPVEVHEKEASANDLWKQSAGADMHSSL